MPKRMHTLECYSLHVGQLLLAATLALGSLPALAATDSLRIGTAALISTTSANSSFPTSADSTHTNSIGTSEGPTKSSSSHARCETTLI